MSLPLVNGAVLLPGAPDWKAGVELSLRWRTEIVTGLTGLEDRAALRDRPEAIMTWRPAAGSVAEVARLAAQIRRAIESGSAAAPGHSRPSLCVSATATTLTVARTPWPWAAGDWLLIGGTAQAGQVSAVAGQVLTLAAAMESLPAAGTPIYPLLFGQLLPQTSEAPSARCQLRVPSWRIGPAAAPLEYRGLLVAPDVIASGATRRALGGRREELISSLAGEADLTAAESFLQRVSGRCDAFWLPAAEMAMTVNDSAPAGFTIVAQGLADEWSGDPGGYLWFAHPTLAPMAARVLSVAAGAGVGTELVTLEETLPVAIDQSWDVFRLRLVRLDDDCARQRTQANGVTALRLEVTALPPGSGVGMRPALLYRFQARLDSARIWRLTDHDAPVVHGGETYLPADISHAEPTPGNLAITCAGADLHFRPDEVIDVVVRRLDATIFTGRVGSIAWVDRKLKLTLGPPVDLRGRALPSFRVGAACNHRLYGAACGLDPAAWSFPSNLATLAGAEVTLASHPGRVDNWFAGGHLRAGAERRTILASAAAQLLLSAPLQQAQPGDAVTAFAGCTHFANQCHSRFDNLARFGGHPFVAEGQPARPLPRFFGWQRLGAAAIAGAANWNAGVDGYRADLLLAVCRGPVDAITHCWIDGRLAWAGELTRGGEESIALEIPGRGMATLFWGNPGQGAQPDLAALGHPAYVGQCYLWMPQFFVGADPANLPRIEVALKRQPVVPWLAHAPASVNEDSNPVAVLAAWLTEPEFGAGLDDSLFDQAQWLAAAVRAAEEDRTASPLIDRELTLGELIDLLCACVDGFLHWTEEGKLRLILRRERPSGLSAPSPLTAGDLVGIDLGRRLPPATRTVVTCVERDRGWTPDEGRWLDDGAFAATGEERTQTVALPWVTRRSAAARMARRAGNPGTRGRLLVRSSAASGIEVGDWLSVDLGEGSGPAPMQCVGRRTPVGNAPAVELEVVMDRPAEDAQEIFDRGDAISHDPPRP